MASLIPATAGTEPVLLKQYKLLGAVIDAPWATRLDHKITRHVIDRYYAKFQNARASLRYLEKATGATRGNIIESLRRITDNGVISVIRQGVGTRPTEYDLNFDFAAKAPRGTPDSTSTSGTVDSTPSGAAQGTSTASSGTAHGTESYLRNMSTDMLTVSRIEDTPAVPTAPPVSGLEADPAASAVDPGGFEALWAVFPRKHQRAKAQAAYKALAPDAALHADLMASAIAWAAHYEKTATEKKWWKHMHTWLVEERYLEDLPEPYENPKEAAIARAREKGPRKADKQQSATKAPIGRHKVKIANFEMPGGSWDQERSFIVSFKIEDGDQEGKKFSHTFKIMSGDEGQQETGQAIYAELRNATGVLEPEDTTDFHDKTLWATVRARGRIEYTAL
jgi:hypothetical protein